MNIPDNGAVFSSNRMDWETPQWLFDQLNDEFHFTLDAAADSKNFKVVPFLSAEQDALKCKWSGRVWCNPPYGRNIGKWVQKAYEESVRGGATVVMLLPVRTDTNWFHEWVYGKAEVRFIRGRVTFVAAENPAPFPSMIVIYRGANDENRSD